MIVVDDRQVPRTPMISADSQVVEFYTGRGFWGSETLTDVIRKNASAKPSGLAFVEGSDSMT